MNASDLTRLGMARRMTKDGTARRLRLAHNVRLTEVAAVVGVSPTTVWRWELAERMVPNNRAGRRYCRLVERWAADEREVSVAAG